MNDLISIIIPVFNAENHLDRCLESIINQTYTNIEIIIVNDGSNDNSSIICERYASDDSRIILATQQNMGVAHARNTGIKLSSGKYIGFVDSDDYIDERMFEFLLRKLISESADIVECSSQIVDGDQNIIRQDFLNNEVISSNYDCLKHYLINKNCKNYCWNKLYSKEILENIEFAQLHYSEDYLFNVKAHYYCKKKIVLSQCLYYYTQNTDGLCLRPFNTKKYDIFKAGEYAINFVRSKNENLVVYIYLYLLHQITYMFNQIKNDGSLSRKYYRQFFEKLKYEFAKNYKTYSDLCKQSKINKSKKLMLCRISPKCYLLFSEAESMKQKIRGKIKRFVIQMTKSSNSDTIDEN